MSDMKVSDTKYYETLIFHKILRNYYLSFYYCHSICHFSIEKTLAVLVLSYEYMKKNSEEFKYLDLGGFVSP